MTTTCSKCKLPIDLDLVEALVALGGRPEPDDAVYPWLAFPKLHKRRFDWLQQPQLLCPTCARSFVDSLDDASTHLEAELFTLVSFMRKRINHRRAKDVT